MNARRNGYKVYCVITDAIGNTVTSDTVTLTMTVSELKIITQPTNAEAADGATVSTKVVASGEGLKYQWYYKSATSSVFVKSSQTTATYSTTMNAQRNGYKVYCVITDVSGKSVTSNTVTLSMSAGLKITLQPCNAAAAKDQTIGVVVLARGEGLKYQWYFKSASASAFSKSSTTTAFYSTTMTAARDGYKVYCVITDANGKSVTSNTVTLTMNNSIATPLKLTAQPVNASAASGADVTVKVVASGEGLKYQWYYKSATSSSFVKSSNTTAIYSTTMKSTRDGYKVYCMVTDQYGNSVKSNTVTLSMKKTLKITTQPTNQSAADGATVSTKVVASGDGLKYQWYFKSATASSFSKSSTTTATYSTTMTSARNGYQVYCVVTDKYGNSVKTDTVTLTME